MDSAFANLHALADIRLVDTYSVFYDVVRFRGGTTPSRVAAPARAPVPTQAATIRATQDRTAAARTMNCRREITLM